MREWGEYHKLRHCVTLYEKIVVRVACVSVLQRCVPLLVLIERFRMKVAYVVGVEERAREVAYIDETWSWSTDGKKVEPEPEERRIKETYEDFDFMEPLTESMDRALTIKEAFSPSVQC